MKSNIITIEMTGYFILGALLIVAVVAVLSPRSRQHLDFKKSWFFLILWLFLGLVFSGRLAEFNILGQFKGTLREAQNQLSEITSLKTQFKNMFEEYSNIIKFYEQAISNGGSEEAYSKLKNKAQESSLENIARIKIDNISSVMQIYMNYLRSWRLDWSDGSSNEKLHTSSLIGFLFWADPAYDQSMKWEIRGRAAQLLSNRKEWPVPDKLIEVMKNKNQLIVKVLALQSFEDLMSDFGYKKKDLFDFQDAITWWDKNRDLIKTKLPQMEN